MKSQNHFRKWSRQVFLLVENAAGHNIKKETKAKLPNESHKNLPEFM